uniref:Uncharacterized protein n=1 Tax=Medicago truncatula TaxID=3880 RepID=Q2HW24_MEDTR|nr:hypothetical protein MtrDRAFT_AC148289g3v2 [Medicago truncatula]
MSNFEREKSNSQGFILDWAYVRPNQNGHYCEGMRERHYTIIILECNLSTVERHMMKIVGYKTPIRENCPGPPPRLTPTFVPVIDRVVNYG